MAGRPRRTNEERRGASQERILDAAEAQFARHGYNGVSLKDIAHAADVDASLLHYYFSTKAGLYSAVIARRSDDANVNRLAALRAYEASAGKGISVPGVVRAYVEATFELARKGGARYLDYLTVIAQMNSTPAGQIPGLENTPFDEVVQVLIELLRKASPGSSDPELYWFYHMLSGAITLSWARTGRIDVLSRGQCRCTDFDAISENMISVFAHGLSD